MKSKALELATPLSSRSLRFRPHVTPERSPPHFRPHPPEQPGFQVDGNRLTLLDTGPRRLDSVLALIDGARTSLRILYYIYADDATGRRVRDAMIAAARRGVTVSVIVDGFGAGADEAFFRPLVEAGARLSRFEPRFGRRYLLRNHQKLALADAKGPSPRSSSAGSISRMIISAPRRPELARSGPAGRGTGGGADGGLFRRAVRLDGKSQGAAARPEQGAGALERVERSAALADRRADPAVVALGADGAR